MSWEHSKVRFFILLYNLDCEGVFDYSEEYKDDMETDDETENVLCKS